MSDPGLQPERTALAWSRTAMALLVNALLLLRMSIQGSPASLLVVALALAMAGLTLFRFARVRTIQLRMSPVAWCNRRIIFITASVSVMAAATGAIAIAHACSLDVTR